MYYYVLLTIHLENLKLEKNFFKYSIWFFFIFLNVSFFLNFNFRLEFALPHTDELLLIFDTFLNIFEKYLIYLPSSLGSKQIKILIIIFFSDDFSEKVLKML